MKIYSHELFEDIKIIELMDSSDKRGSFTKLYHATSFIQANLNFEIAEIYYSVSQKDVIRGMHFQLPPNDHEKIIHVMNGKIIDIIVDLRKESCTYKKYIALELTSTQKKAIYIPKGFAHGFKSLEDGTVMQYCVSSVYDSNSDCGILYDSIGYSWDIANPIISDRDKSFVSMDEFISPF